MPDILQISGDLLTSNADVIVQQCNCVTIRAHGLSSKISAAFPYADLYGTRTAQSSNTATKETRGVPGECVVMSPPAGKPGPYVANIVGQIAPGKPGVWAVKYKIDPGQDNASARINYFQNALDELAKKCNESKWSRIAFPIDKNKQFKHDEKGAKPLAAIGRTTVGGFHDSLLSLTAAADHQGSDSCELPVFVNC